MKIFDLSHLINNETTIYPGSVKPSIKITGDIIENGYSEHELTLGTHTGTHVDAPSHMILNGKSLDQLPFQKYIGKAIVIPCKGRKEIDVTYLETFKEKISQVNYILFYTGWDKNWKSSDYLGDYPTLTPEATQWLTDFNLDGLGFDVISVDKVKVTYQINHHTLLKHEILIIENLTQLDQLPSDIFTFQCIPLKIENADGSPIRAIAIVND
ncbi:MAG: cyclase family protein [Bacteroidales bacterium]|nr:cyclase family protein [Bacteroidales bacterium]